MDKEQVIELVKKYTDVIRKKFNVNKVVLYGSYSRGDQKEWSDIDVAVFINKKEGDILTNEFNLYKLRRDIDSRIEPIILDEENDESGFAQEVLKSGIIVYQSN
jgi:predicted nucleotidyltransferase